MVLPSCLLMLAFLMTPVGSAVAAEPTKSKPLEPEIAEASNEPEEVVAGITVKNGWDISVFAAEPLVANVVAFDIDHRGRFFVCESFRQTRGVTDNRAHDEQWLLADLSAKTVQDRIDYHKRLLGDAAVTYAQHDDRIRRIVDTDGDGKADESTVFANGFNALEEGTGASVLVRGKDVYYTCIPKLWKLVDADDDGVVDERIVMSDGYGVRVAFRGHDLHGLLVGYDGRLYFSIGDRGYHLTTAEGELIANPTVGAVFRCEMDGSGLEVYCNGLRNPQELAFNDVGDFFSVDNNSDSGDQARIVHLLQHGDSGWRMFYQYLEDRGPFNREKVWEPLHKEQPAYIVPPIANFTDGPSGLAHYPGTGFGDTLKDQFLICDFRGGPSNSGIRSFKLNPDGAFYTLADDDQPLWTVLATDAAFGPDGALYVSDWVDGWNGLGKGRIYRVTDPKHHDDPIVGEVKSLLSGDWTLRGVDELVGDLTHQDRRVRLEAQWELARRGDAQPLLSVILDTAAGRIARLHGIWGLDQIARRDDDSSKLIFSAVRGLLAAKDDVIRAAAVRFAGERGDRSALARLTELVDDPSPRVRYFTAMALGQMGAGEALDSVAAEIARNNNEDPALRHAGVMFMTMAVAPDRIAGLAGHGSRAVRRAAVVALRRLESPLVKAFLDDPNELVVAEAARAIHDQPIPAALGDLAAMISRDINDTNTIQRVLNANFRIGTDETAFALAGFASDEGAPELMRVEALELLNAWAEPDPRDRVINDYRPLKSRPAGVAAKAMRSAIDDLMASKDAVRESAIDVASKLGLTEISPNLVKRVNDPVRLAATRASALIALGRLDSRKAVEIAKSVPLTPATELLDASFRILAEHETLGSIPRFIAGTKSARTQVRQLAWDILGTIKTAPARDSIQKAANEYLEGVLPKDVALNVLEAVEKQGLASVSTKVDQRTKELEETDPLAKWLPSLVGGNPELGAKLFFGKTELSCVRCHKVDRAGGE
ncbi:MAG: PVC-type heme-binding CxxCH protein, partial [Planctomycetota bacterium]